MRKALWKVLVFLGPWSPIGPFLSGALTFCLFFGVIITVVLAL